MASKLELASISFQTVLRHVEHEDDKANRILFAMAFITAAAGAIFTAVQGNPDPIATVFGRAVNLTFFTFALFVTFVLSGTLFMLAALGPKHNLLGEWRNKQTEWTEGSSLLFSQAIDKLPYQAWRNHWSDQDTEVLRAEMEEHLVRESYLIARKAVHKVAMMTIGRQFYVCAMAALSWFLAVSFAGNLELGIPLGGLMTSLVLLYVFLEKGLEPAGKDDATFLRFAGFFAFRHKRLVPRLSQFLVVPLIIDVASFVIQDLRSNPQQKGRTFFLTAVLVLACMIAGVSFRYVVVTW